MKTCTIDGCNNKHEARGFCPKHYARWKKHKNPHQAWTDKKFCVVEGCEKDYYSKNCCETHYRRLRLYGSPEGEPVRVSGEARFLSRLTKGSEEGSCWVWQGRLCRKGYGEFDLADRAVKAHRFSYELHKGAIPEGMQVDHMCHNRACVNPRHLRTVTNAENQQNRKSFTSTSGYRNVYKHPNGRYTVRVGKDGVEYYGGMFKDVYHAHLRAEGMRAMLFTHNSEG